MTRINTNSQRLLLSKTTELYANKLDFSRLPKTSVLQDRYCCNISHLQQKNFVQLSCCVLDHIISTNDLNPFEKLYYLVNYFYSQLFDSWNASSNNSSKKEIEFSAKKMGELLDYSKSKIFRLQKGLEEKEYLAVKRSLSNFGTNKVNVPIVTIPNNIFKKLIKNNQNKRGENIETDLNIDPLLRTKILNKLKTYVPINIDLAREIFFNKNLSDNSKLLYLKLLSTTHRQKLKNNYQIYAGYFELPNLAQDCSISTSTLHRCLKALEDNNLIKTSIITVKRNNTNKEKDYDNNRFDKKLKYVEILLPESLKEKYSSKDRVSPVDPQSVTSRPSYIIEKEKEKNKFKNRSMKSNFKDLISKIGHSKLGKHGKSLDTEKKTDYETRGNLKTKKDLQISSDASKKSKSLIDFHPLNKDDCYTLRQNSGREFSDNAINEIVKDMSNKVTEVSFYSKKGFVSYMSKALQFEMRNEDLVNNETFKIKANMSEDEKLLDNAEKYLKDVEYSLDTTPEMHFRKKLAATLDPMKAYSLLTSTNKIFLDGDSLVFCLSNYVDLSEMDKKIILNQVKAVYSFVDSSLSFIGAIRVEFRQDLRFKKVTAGLEQEELPDNIWGKVRELVIKRFGKDVDRNWFSSSKVLAEIDDKKKLIKLSAASLFLKDYINRDYIEDIGKFASNLGYELGEIDKVEAVTSSGSCRVEIEDYIK